MNDYERELGTINQKLSDISEDLKEHREAFGKFTDRLSIFMSESSQDRKVLHMKVDANTSNLLEHKRTHNRFVRNASVALALLVGLVEAVVNVFRWIRGQ